MKVRILFMQLLLLISVCGAVFAQEVYTPLATMEGRSFTPQDLPANVGDAWLKLSETLSDARKQLLENQIDDLILKQEAEKRSTTVDELVEKEITNKVPDPTQAEILKIYDENKASLGNIPLSEIRDQVIEYLRIEPEQEKRKEFLAELRKSVKIEYGKNLDEAKLSPSDMVATVGGVNITHSVFIHRNGLALYEYEANVFDEVDVSLRMIVDAAIYQSEAQSLGIPVNELIQREVTSKMKDFSVDEQNKLESDLRNRLYTKFRVKYFITEPKPYVQFVSADDDPFTGKATAPVTVIIFADYECPACATVHPIIKQIAAKYGDRVRLVYRDFPLEKAHDNAFGAAVAANAARAQNKFFEYTEKLYNNQEALDIESLRKYASELGLDMQKFNADIANPASAAEVRKDIDEGESYGVTGTPSIFVNGYKVRTLSARAFEDAIKRAIAGEF